jgi:hypothetical protein
VRPSSRRGKDEVGHGEEEAEGEPFSPSVRELLDHLDGATESEDSARVAFVPDGRAEVGEDWGIDFA